MTSQQRKNLEAYIERYYCSYFQMDSIYNDWASANKIQDTSLFVLNEISKQEVCTQRSLRDRLGYSKQTISSALRRLEAAGIIVRQRAPQDQRNNLIRLTSNGKEYADSILSRLRNAEVHAFQSWSEAETEEILTAFQKLTSALFQSLQADINAQSEDP